MKAAILVEVDDALFAAYSDELKRKYEHVDGWWPTPQEFFMERMVEVASDELHVALWGWADEVGMTVTVEEG